MQKERKGIKGKYRKALNAVKRFFSSSDNIKGYDGGFYEWLEKNYKNLNEEELEKIKSRAEKSKKALNAIKKFIEENWKSDDFGKREAVASLIGVFKLKEYIDKLVVLSFDGSHSVKEKTVPSCYRIFNENIWNWLSRKENREKVIGTVKEFIEEKWDSENSLIRENVVSLIEFFELKEYYDKLVVLSFGGRSIVKDKARKSFEKLMGENVNSWLSKEENREKVVNTVREFVEGKWKSNESNFREAVVDLIEIFGFKEYIDKLVVLSFDGEGAVKRKARKAFEKLMGENVNSWLSKEENRGKVIGTVKEFVEENWDNMDKNIREAVASLIGVFELEEHVDKLVVLSFDGGPLVNEKARESFKKLFGEDVESWLSKEGNKKKVFNTVKEFVEENLNSEDLDAKEAVASLIGVFELKEYYDKLIELSFDEYSIVIERAIEAVEKIGKDNFSERHIELVKNEIQNNWKSENSGIRKSVASLIGVFELKEYYDKLIVLSFDGEGAVKRKARESFKKLFGEDVESWLSKEENRKKVLGTVREFVEDNWKSEDWGKKMAVASLIGVFELEKYIDKLIVLCFDNDPDLSINARKSLNKIGAERFKEYLDNLGGEKRGELKDKFKSYFNEEKNRYELIRLIKDCSPLLILSVY